MNPKPTPDAMDLFIVNFTRRLDEAARLVEEATGRRPTTAVLGQGGEDEFRTFIPRPVLCYDPRHPAAGPGGFMLRYAMVCGIDIVAPVRARQVLGSEIPIVRPAPERRQAQRRVGKDRRDGIGNIGLARREGERRVGGERRSPHTPVKPRDL